MMGRDMADKTFTASDPDALLELFRRVDPLHGQGGYEWNLNGPDMKDVLTCLYTVAHDSDGDPDFQDRIASLYSGIATTLGVELI